MLVAPSPSPPQRLSSVVQGIGALPAGAAIAPATAMGQVQGIPAAAETQAQAMEQGCHPIYVLFWDEWEPLPLKAMFDGRSEKLAYFLNQVWNHLEQYGQCTQLKLPM